MGFAGRIRPSSKNAAVYAAYKEKKKLRSVKLRGRINIKIRVLEL